MLPAEPRLSHLPIPTEMRKIYPKIQSVRRYAANPIITADMAPFSGRGIFNSSVVKHEDRYVMVLRCEGYNLLFHPRAPEP